MVSCVERSNLLFHFVYLDFRLHVCGSLFFSSYSTHLHFITLADTIPVDCMLLYSFRSALNISRRVGMDQLTWTWNAPCQFSSAKSCNGQQWEQSRSLFGEVGVLKLEEYKHVRAKERAHLHKDENVWNRCRDSGTLGLRSVKHDIRVIRQVQGTKKPWLFSANRAAIALFVPSCPTCHLLYPGINSCLDQAEISE